MARMLGAAGFAGTGCSPSCRRTHTPRPRRAMKAQRAYEKRQWRREAQWPV
jgi:hypothetical protein